MALPNGAAAAAKATMKVMSHFVCWCSHMGVLLRGLWRVFLVGLCVGILERLSRGESVLRRFLILILIFGVALGPQEQALLCNLMTVYGWTLSLLVLFHLSPVILLNARLDF